MAELEATDLAAPARRRHYEGAPCKAGPARRRIRRRARAAASAAAVGVLVLCSSAALAAAPAPRAGGPVGQGLSFYRNKTITLIVSSVVGGNYDLFARALQPYLESYLHATVNVENIATGGSALGDDQFAGASPNGLTALVTPLFVAISQYITGQIALNFNFERTAWIAAVGPTPQVVIATPASPYTSIAAMKAATSPIRVIGANAGGLIGGLEPSFFGLLHLNVQLLGGYSSAALQLTGYERGDAPVALLNLTMTGPLISKGQARPLATTVFPPPGTAYRAQLAGVPTYAQVFKMYPPKTKLARTQVAALLYLANSPSGLLALQGDVSGDKVAAMRAAAQWAFRQPGFKQAMLAASNDTAYFSGFTAKQLFIASVNEEKSLACFVARTC